LWQANSSKQASVSSYLRENNASCKKVAGIKQQETFQGRCSEAREEHNVILHQGISMSFYPMKLLRLRPRQLNWLYLNITSSMNSSPIGCTL
jgi:hypothetical protein